MTEKPTVTLLPETDDVLVCVTYSGIVNLKDFEDVFFSRVRQNFAKTGRVRALLNYDDDYKGWEEEAAAANFLSITEYATRAEKIAYVGPPGEKVFQMRLLKPMVGETRFFEKDEFEKALEWVKS